MKYSLFSLKLQKEMKILRISFLACEGKALVRGIFTETCFSEKETVK